MSLSWEYSSPHLLFHTLKEPICHIKSFLSCNYFWRLFIVQYVKNKLFRPEQWIRPVMHILGGTGGKVTSSRATQRNLISKKNYSKQSKMKHCLSPRTWKLCHLRMKLSLTICGNIPFHKTLISEIFASFTFNFLFTFWEVVFQAYTIFPLPLAFWNRFSVSSPG